MRKWEGWSNATTECDTTVVDAAIEAKIGTCADKWCMTFMYKVQMNIHILLTHPPRPTCRAKAVRLKVASSTAANLC
jgi:hypothetical protein